MNKLLLMDFGSRFTNDIKEILEKLNIGYELVSHDYDFSLVDNDVKGIIFTGSKDTVYENGRRCQSDFIKSSIPKLGICYGHQLVNDELGGIVEKAKVSEMDVQTEITIDVDNPIFANMNKIQKVSMFHNDEVVKLGDGFVCLAHGDNCRYAAAYNEKYNIYSLQYHPECNKYADYSEEYFSNFAKICEL